MNTALLVLASLNFFQANNQKITGSIVNDTSLRAGNPFMIVIPEGTLKFSGPVTKVLVKICAGQLDKSGKFVVDNSIYSGEAAIEMSDKIPKSGEFNWFANTFTFPGAYPYAGMRVTVKATLELYGGSPPELKVEKATYKTIQLP